MHSLQYAIIYPSLLKLCVFNVEMKVILTPHSADLDCIERRRRERGPKINGWVIEKSVPDGTYFTGVQIQRDS